jgi:GntR family transcriptional repressor for pyruvate dehydrogenase complex
VAVGAEQHQGSGAGDAAPDPAVVLVPLRRVRKSYEQVADQLRDLIVRGQLRQGGRLPPEATLARELGVSRATVREALRLLAAQGLIRTAKGSGGGSFVTLPTVDHISESLS